jgi:hypothetical protein
MGLGENCGNAPEPEQVESFVLTNNFDSYDMSMLCRTITEASSYLEKTKRELVYYDRKSLGESSCDREGS